MTKVAPVSVLTAHNLVIGYPRRGRVITDELNLTLFAGELVCLLGVNGAGKTTLMRTLAGMQAPISGEVRIDGMLLQSRSAAELARKVSLVLTERVDVGMLTAHELVMLGRYPYSNWMGRLTDFDMSAVQQALEDVGAESLANRTVTELSDGERQKIMIARALAQATPLMILDEPTAFLDLPRRAEVMYMLRRLAHLKGRAVLLSTHDLELALRCADSVWLMSESGRLTIGAPEDLVLSGAFAAAFYDQSVRFDPLSGAFSVDTESVGLIRVVGSGAVMLWTRRALERIGYEVDTTAEDVIEVAANGWSGQVGGVSYTWENLGAMVNTLRTLSSSTNAHRGEAIPTPISRASELIQSSGTQHVTEQTFK